MFPTLGKNRRTKVQESLSEGCFTPLPYSVSAWTLIFAVDRAKNSEFQLAELLWSFLRCASDYPPDLLKRLPPAIVSCLFPTYPINLVLMRPMIFQKLASTWCEWPQIKTPHELALAHNLARRLHQIALQLGSDQFHTEAIILWKETIGIFQKLDDCDPNRHQANLALCLYDAEHFGSAEPIERYTYILRRKAQSESFRLWPVMKRLIRVGL